MILMVQLCLEKDKIYSSIETIGSISNIIIASLTLILAFYVFIYQRTQDNNNKIKLEKSQNQNIRLQWFKEIIIQPRIQYVFNFYENISGIKDKIRSNELSEKDKIEILNYIKKEQSELRQSFLELIQSIDITLYNDFMLNVDNLTDNLTITISNDELKLNHEITYNREIESKIKSSYNQFLSNIFNYSG